MFFRGGVPQIEQCWSPPLTSHAMDLYLKSTLIFSWLIIHYYETNIRYYGTFKFRNTLGGEVLTGKRLASFTCTSQ